MSDNVQRIHDVRPGRMCRRPGVSVANAGVNPFFIVPSVVARVVFKTHTLQVTPRW